MLTSEQLRFLFQYNLSADRRTLESNIDREEKFDQKLLAANFLLQVHVFSLQLVFETLDLEERCP